MIRELKNEKLLKQMIQEGKLTVTDKNKQGMDPLMFAVDCEFSGDLVEYLIKAGCSVNAQDQTGRTALHYACDLENSEIVDSLLRNGADPRIKDNTGLSPLDEATENEEIFDLLKEKEESLAESELK
jgi:ankyrin repeat protein